MGVLGGIDRLVCWLPLGGLVDLSRQCCWVEWVGKTGGTQGKDEIVVRMVHSLQPAMVGPYPSVTFKDTV